MDTLLRMRERRAAISRRTAHAARRRSRDNARLTTTAANALCDHPRQDGQPRVTACSECYTTYVGARVTVSSHDRYGALTVEHGWLDASDEPYAAPVVLDSEPPAPRGVAARLDRTPDSERLTRNAPPVVLDAERLLRMRHALRYVADAPDLLREWTAEPDVLAWLAEQELAEQRERQRAASEGLDWTAPVGNDREPPRTTDGVERAVTVTRPDGTTYTFLPSERAKARRSAGRRAQQRAKNRAAVRDAVAEMKAATVDADRRARLAGHDGQ